MHEDSSFFIVKTHMLLAFNAEASDVLSPMVAAYGSTFILDVIFPVILLTYFVNLEF